MAFEALINTITLLCLVLCGLWILAHVRQVVVLLLMRRAYRRHSKNLFTIPFVPLHTRLFHELAVPQYLAAEAIQRGDVPPAPRGAAQLLQHVGSLQSPGVAPSLTLQTSSSGSFVRGGSVLAGSPLSSLTNTEDSSEMKARKKTITTATALGKEEGSGARKRKAGADSPVEVPVPPPGTMPEKATAAAAAEGEEGTPSWWSPKLDGQNLVLGLQLPLQLQTTTHHSLAARLEKAVRGAGALSHPPQPSGRASRSPSPPARTGEKKSGAAGVGVSSSSSSAANVSSQRRQPTVNLQLRQFQLTSSTLANLTGVKSHYLDTTRAGGPGSSRGYARGGGADLYGAQALHAAIAAQLAAAPMQVSTRPLLSSAAVPRRALSFHHATEIHGGGGTGLLDFDAIKYAYVHNFQRLLEVAVAEQTAMAHRGQYDRKSAKRAQRIAAVLMQYLQYTHEDDDEDTALDDSLEDEAHHTRTISGGDRGDAGGSPDTLALHSPSYSGSANGSMMEPGAASHSSNSDIPMRRRWKQSPWVPLLADTRNDHGGARHIDAGASASNVQPKRLSHSFSQLSAVSPPSSVIPPQRIGPGKKHLKRHRSTLSAGANGTFPPSKRSPTKASSAVIAVPPPVHETRRSSRKRREAALDIADTAVDALEALVERVRQAQALRPRYRALFFTVNFRAERFIVRRGGSGPPTWTALPSPSSVSRQSTKPNGTVASTSSRGDDIRGGGSGLPSSLVLRNGSSAQTSGLTRRRRSLNAPGSGLGVCDNNFSDTSELVPDSSLASALDSRTDRSGGQRRTGPPSPDQSTTLPINRSLTADFTGETAAGAESGSSAGSPLQAGGTYLPSSAWLFPRPTGTAAATPSLPTPTAASTATTAAQPIAFVSPMASSSANDAAAEFLRARRRLALDAAPTVPSFDYARHGGAPGRGAANAGGRPTAQGSGSSDNDEWGSPLATRRQRRTSASGGFSRSETTSATGSSPLLRHEASSVCSVDGDAARLLSPRPGGPVKAGQNGASRAHASPSSSSAAAAKGSGSAGNAQTSVSSSREVPTGVAVPRAPRECDLRMVYVIGADRTTLLRSLTLNATQIFSAGAQNFLCFFTHEDEQRARRRYLEEMDRQYRRELQQRVAERTRAPQPAQAGLAAGETQSDSDLDVAGLQPYRIDAPLVAPPPPQPVRTTSGVASFSLRHARATSWHAVGMSGSGVFSEDAGAGREGGTAAGTSHEAPFTPSESLYSFYSCAEDSAAMFAPPFAAAGNALVPESQKPGVPLEVSFLNSSDTLAPHSLEASLYASGELRGPLDRRRTSVYAAATELPETHGFETVPSLPSSMISDRTSTLLMGDHTDMDRNTATAGEADAPHVAVSACNNGAFSASAEASAEDVAPHAAQGGEGMLSLPSSDNAFAHSLYSLDSETEDRTADKRRSNDSFDNEGGQPRHLAFAIEVSAAPASAATLSGKPPAPSPPPPLSSNFSQLSQPPTADCAPAEATREEENNALDAASDPVTQTKKRSKKVSASSPPVEKPEPKRKSKKEAKKATTPTKAGIAPAGAAATGVSADGAAAPAASPVPPLSPLAPPLLPTLELPDTIGDHDVRRYHAAVGVTLPEQIFLLRDVQADTEAPTAAHGVSLHSRRSGAYTPTRRGAPAQPGVLRTSSSLAALQSAAMPPSSSQAHTATTAGKRGAAPNNGGAGGSGGAGAVARVLEGQVEVAELSLDVLRRQLGPFVPQSTPSVTTRVNSSEEGGDSSDEESTDDRDSGSSNSSGSVEFSSDEEREGTSLSASSSADDEVDEASDHRRRRRGKASQKAPPRRQRHRQQQQQQRRKRKAAQSKGGREERDARESSRGDRGSSHRRRAEPRRGASRHTSRHRRQRERQQQRRRAAAVRRRILRKQAAANKAGFSPVSLATLFFTAPPELPRMLLRQLETQRTAYENATLPLPSWAVGVPATGSTLGGSATLTAAGASPVSSQRTASICVTLIYTSTAEQVTRTLLLANEMATAERAARQAAQAYSSLENSLISLTAPGSGGGHRRGSWSEEGLDGPHGDRLRHLPADRFGSSLADEDAVWRGGASINTCPPSPLDTSVRSGRVRAGGVGGGDGSLYNSRTASPPPAADSGTATFAGDEASSFSESQGRGGGGGGGRSSGAKEKSRTAEGGSGRDGDGDASTAATAEKSPPLPPLLLLTESDDSFADAAGDTGEGIPRTSTATFTAAVNSFDRSRSDGRRVRKEDTLCFNDDGVAAANANNTATLRFGETEGAVGDEVEEEGEGSAAADRQLTTPADAVVDVLRDVVSFPEGVPVGVSLTYVRIGNDLYAVTEVVDRTFLQYREERVIQPHTQAPEDGGGAEAGGGVGGGGLEAVRSLTSALSASDFSDDGEARNGGSSANSSFSSDTPFSALDAALEAIQSQHEASARQQRRRMHHRRRAVSTMNFGQLSYSLAGSAPLRPGTRRQEVHMCWRCLSAEAAVIFLPCGHYAVCEECAEVLADCCVCRTPILSSVVLLERQKTQRASSVTRPPQQPQPQSARRHRSPRESVPEQ